MTVAVWIFKAIAAVLIRPLLLATVGLLVGIVLWRRARSRAGVAIMATSLAIAYAGSISWVGDALLGPLEAQYEGIAVPLPAEVHDVVVLGSSYDPRDRVPVTGALSGEGLARLVEGVRILRQIPQGRLIVSGGAAPGFAPSAQGYALMAAQLGVDSGSLVVLDRPLNTHDEAGEVARLLGAAPYVLVTSAYHMPRAMRLMRAAGTHPTAAPTAQLVHIGRHGVGILPSAYGLRETELALHEYLGTLALHLGLY